MEIYGRIKFLRKEILHLSQASFGESLGVNRDMVNNIENNRLARPDQKEPLYKLICKTFNVREEWLKNGEEPIYQMDAEEDPYIAAMTEIDIKDPKAKQAILDYWKLSPEDKELFWKFADRFLRNETAKPED